MKIEIGKVIGLSLIIAGVSFGQSMTNRADVAEELTIDSALIMSQQDYEVTETGITDATFKTKTTKLGLGITGAPSERIGLYAGLGFILSGETENTSPGTRESKLGQDASGLELIIGIKGKIIENENFSLLTNLEFDTEGRKSEYKDSDSDVVTEKISYVDLNVGVTAATTVASIVTPFLGVQYALLSRGEYIRGYKDYGIETSFETKRKSRLSINPGVSVALDNVDIKAEAILANQQTFMLGAGLRM